MTAAAYTVVFGAIAVATAVLVFVYVLGLEDEDIWSISIYQGTTPLRLSGHPAHGTRPAIEARHVGDCRAGFVADPFLVNEDGRWLMFLEVFNRSTRKGEIAVASSTDGVDWNYDRLVLREPFHLSYPQVFKSAGVYYMIPESRHAGEVRLYRAVDFPYEWRMEARVLEGSYVDPTIVRHDGRWWLFSQQDGRSLALHHADRLQGPWTEHPQSPVVRDSIGTSRPGGRVLELDGQLIRFAQDGEITYGRRLRAFAIDQLTLDGYREHEIAESPVLDATRSGWNADGMHHLDAQKLGDRSWIAAVDGKRIDKRFNWRRGVRRLMNAAAARGRPGHGIQ